MSSMAEGGEDTELRDLVAQTLENNGVLNKIRAQLRASVFLALEEQPSYDNKCLLINKEFNKFVSTDDGRTVTCLIREFLEHFNLEYTKSVFVPETEESIQCNYNGRERLLEDLGFDRSVPTDAPVLLEVLHRSLIKSAPLQLSPRNISLSKEMFNNCDKNKNGKIDKESASDLFMDMFPNFRRSLVDRFILDEYTAMGKNSNAELTLDEFCNLHKKLFSICQSVAFCDATLFLPVSNKVQKTKMSTVETINTSPKSSAIGIEKSDFSFPTAQKPNSEVALLGNLVKSAHQMMKDDTADGDDSFYDYDDLLYKPHKSNSSVKTRVDLTGGSNRCSTGSETNPKLYRDPLPPLGPPRNQDTGKDSPSLATLERDINSKLADLSNEDYDEDFQSSGQKTGSEGSIGEEIEDTSAFGDILGSTASGISLQGNDNMTTDKSVSQVSHSGVDYLESFNHDSGDQLL